MLHKTGPSPLRPLLIEGGRRHGSGEGRNREEEGGNEDTEGEEEEEWLKTARIQEEKLKATLKAEGKQDQWTDWDKRLEEYEEERRKEDRQRTERIERANKKHESLELLRVCRELLRENSVIWRDNKMERDAG